MEWIKSKDYTYGQVTAHEIICPKCGYKETYISTPPDMCYRCETELRGISNG